MSRHSNGNVRWALLVSIDQEKMMVAVVVVVRRVYVCWLRNSGTMPSSPLGSPARSLQYAVWEPSDPGSSVCPQGREESGWKAERATDREKERRRGGMEKCRPRSNPSGMCSTDSPCQRSLTKPTPSLSNVWRSPARKWVLGGNKKCQQTVVDL